MIGTIYEQLARDRQRALQDAAREYRLARIARHVRGWALQAGGAD